MSVALSRYFNSLTTWENLEEVGVVSSVVEKKYKLRAHCHLGHIELKQCVPLQLGAVLGRQVQERSNLKTVNALEHNVFG